MRHRITRDQVTGGHRTTVARLGRYAATAAAGVVLLAACSTPSGTGGSGASGSGGAQEGGTVTVGLAEAPDALDPTVASTYVGRIVFANMCQKLYDVDAKLNLVPQLASALPQITDGGRTYTVKLRPGVRFNDGTALDAAAVKKTLDHYLTDPKSARAAELSAVQKVATAGTDTVRITLKQPFAPLTAILADRSGMVLSPKALAKGGAAFARQPVCVGPFTLASRPSSDQITLKKSTYYYDRKNVHLDQVKFTVVTQPNVRAANLRSGDIDVADRVDTNDVATLKRTQGVRLSSVTSLGYDGIDVNVANRGGSGKGASKPVALPLARSAELRQAFALTIDRDALNQVMYQGQYVPGCTPISPANPYAPDVSCPKPDVAKAKQLVAKSGIETPVRVKLVVQAANSQATKLGTLVQSQAKKAGFAVSVQPTEFTTALSQADEGRFETFDVGWSGRLDPDQNIAPFWDPESALNYTGANYPDVMKLIAAERATTDMAKRKAIFTQLSKLLLKYNNIIYLDYPKVVLGSRTGVSGIQYYGDGLIRLGTARRTGS